MFNFTNYSYVVGSDQDFGGVDATRGEMLRWYGEKALIGWEALAYRDGSHTANSHILVTCK